MSFGIRATSRERRRLNGQNQAKSRAGADDALNLDSSIVLLDDRVCPRQLQTGTLAGRSLLMFRPGVTVANGEKIAHVLHQGTQITMDETSSLGRRIFSSVICCQAWRG
jgi:hypothetical protein